MKFKYLIVLLSVIMFSCQESEEIFDNKVFNQSSQGMVTTTRVKSGMTEVAQTIQAAIPMQANHDITVVYEVDEGKVFTYNNAYYDNAILLPADFYEIPVKETVIYKNSTQSAPLDVKFKQLNLLDREKTYVLPVSIVSADGLEILESTRDKYFVFKAGALINVVAGLEKNYLSVKWKNPEPLRKLNKMTLEALIKVQKYDRQISTIMGIEGKFLLRFGDASYPSNQLQVSVGRDFFPGADNKKGLPTNKWIHIAVTYDNSGGGIQIYINGELQSEDKSKSYGSFELSYGEFFIGKSWDDQRYLSGDICECRIWNVVRTREEIANNFYAVDPNTPGLVAYWKFDEGDGIIVKDHTVNANHATANAPLQWIPEELPAMK